MESGVGSGDGFGRWVTIDPLTEKYHDISPFAYCANNPVMYIDPDGRRIWPAFKALMDGMSGSLTMGLQATAQVGVGEISVGFELNGGSTEVLSMNGDNKKISIPDANLKVGSGINALLIGGKDETTWSIDPPTGNITKKMLDKKQFSLKLIQKLQRLNTKEMWRMLKPNRKQ